MKGIRGRLTLGILGTVARVAVGAVLAYAGLMKLVEPAANFEAVLGQYDILPQGWISVLARTIPWVEWITGMLLVLGYMISASAFAAAVLSLAFVMALSGALGTDEALKGCGCFGSRGIVLTVRQAFWLDWSNLVLAIFIFFSKHRPFSLDNLLSKPRGDRS